MHATMTEQTLQQLAEFARVGLPDLATVRDHITTVQLQPGECAFRQGDRQRALFVVRSGLLKQYYVGVAGNTAIKSFTARGDVFACIESLLGEGETTFASEAIEPSVVERMDTHASNCSRHVTSNGSGPWRPRSHYWLGRKSDESATCCC